MRNRKSIIYAIFTVFMIVIMELSAYTTIRVAGPMLSEPIVTTRQIYRDQSELIRRWLAVGGRGRDIVDGTVGWKYRPGYHDATDQISAQGLRASREYAPLPAPGVVRVAAFGDSFVYGNEVARADAWASIVESTFTNIEMLNYGVGGYGLDQALLRYRTEGDLLSPQVVLIGFIADDIRRVVNVYQRFALVNQGLFTKPRFRLAPDGGLELLPSPIQTLDDWRPVLEEPELITAWGKNDQWYEPLVYENPLHDVSASVRLLSAVWIRLDNRYFDPDRLFIGRTLNPSANAFRLQMAIFSAFVAEARANGSYPLILFIPSRGELQAAHAGSEPVYAPIIEQLRAAEIPYWDATEAFVARPEISNTDVWFEPGGHYSPTGNRIVAEWLGPRLLALQQEALIE